MMRKLISIHSVLLLLAAWAGFGLSTAAAQPQEIPLGSKMPMADRALPGVDGASTRLADAKGARGTVVVFWSNECPWVEKYEPRLLQLASEYLQKGFGFVLINPNDAVAFPKEAPAESQRRAQAGRYPMGYLTDSGSAVAAAFGATRTPHVFVFDADDTLVYVGTIDDSPGDPNNVQKRYLKDALDTVMGGGDLLVPKTKAFGCMIKYQ